jgi:hypothetical protein
MNSSRPPLWVVVMNPMNELKAEVLKAAVVCVVTSCGLLLHP